MYRHKATVLLRSNKSFSVIVVNDGFDDFSVKLLDCITARGIDTVSKFNLMVRSIDVIQLL